MTRWLYLCSDLGIPLDGTKGASEHVRAITRALARSGDQVFVLSPRGSLPPEHPAQQINPQFGAAARRLGQTVHAWLSTSDAPAGLATDVAQLVYDAELLAWMAAADCPLPDVDVVIERLALFSAAGREFARRRELPYLVEVNAPMAQEAACYRDARLSEFAQWIEARTLRTADVVMTVSDPLRKQLIESAGLDGDRVVAVPNGVDLELFKQSHDRAAVRMEARVPPDAVGFVFVGSLKVWHGVDALLEAFRSVARSIPNAHLLIVGDGRRLDYYRSVVRAGGLSKRVSFFGGTDHATVARLLTAMDVAVAPYLPQATFYFSPLKLYEYMAAGLCTIASRAGQIEQVIEDGHNGLLVEPGDAASLAAAMMRAGRDAALRARLGAIAQRRVAPFSWDHTADRIRGLAAGALARRRSFLEEPPLALRAGSAVAAGHSGHGALALRADT